MIIVHCSALVSKAVEQVKLISLLKHHGISYELQGERVKVDGEFEDAKSAEDLIALFDSILWEARGVSIIEE